MAKEKLNAVLHVPKQAQLDGNGSVFVMQVALAFALIDQLDSLKVIVQGAANEGVAAEAAPLGFALPLLEVNGFVHTHGHSAMFSILSRYKSSDLKMSAFEADLVSKVRRQSVQVTDQMAGSLSLHTLWTVFAYCHCFGEPSKDFSSKWYVDALQYWISLESHAVVADLLTRITRRSAMVRCIKDGVAFEYDWSVERVPLPGKRNILITAALPYVNNVPHLGNIIGAVLSADVFARFCRLRGHQTLYVCGTDEYGTATETKALEEGVSCAELCGKYFRLHSAIYNWFGIDTDYFGRSSTARQTAITHEIFKGLYDNGYFFEDTIEQSYCEKCQRFLADRYVEGTCPHCKYDDARGDQCDGCGKLLSPVELVKPQCKVCRQTPERRETRHLFLDLTSLQPLVDQFVVRQSVAGDWSSNSTSISRGWLAEGLRPQCMTRDLTWGTPVPVVGFENKVFYVWFDACFGYISITAGYTPEHWREWWQCNVKNDAPKVELFQFMGKDNVRFHTVIFPSCLMGTSVQKDQVSEMISNETVDCPWTLLHHISTTEYLNYEEGKFSKSRGVGVFGNDARDSGVPATYWRYYLLSMRPESMDAAFSWDDFTARINNELLANIGNLTNRVAKFVVARMQGMVPKEAAPIIDQDLLLVERMNAELALYVQCMDSVHLKSGLKHAMAMGQLVNGYIAEVGLDNRLLASDPLRCARVLTVSLNAIYLLSAVLDPFLPAASADMRSILNAPSCQIPDQWDVDVLMPGHCINPTPFHLFNRMDPAFVQDLRVKYAGKQQL